jgi:hypothetical protein
LVTTTTRQEATIYLYDHVARRTGGNSLALGMRHAF